MLKRLHIRNYALIDEVEIYFSDHLTIITGETGAGKSILLGALGLVMGERADSKVFYNDTEKCIVEAIFDVRHYDLDVFFQENELDLDSEVVIRREVAPNGKSRAFVNDTPVNNQVLQRLTEALIDLHQQFDTLDIHNINFQLRMIDALADNQSRLKDYQQAYQQYAKGKRRLAEMIDRSVNSAKEMEFFRYQFDELQQAELIEGEQEQLEVELSRLSNAEDIKRTYAQAGNLLVEHDQNMAGQIQELLRSMSATRRFSPTLASVAERLENMLAEVQDIGKECDKIAEGTEFDSERIETVQERLNLIYKLQKKHNLGSLKDLLQLQAELESRLGSFFSLEDEISALQANLEAQEQMLRQRAAELSERRRSVTDSFESKVKNMLGQLAMPHAELRVDIKLFENLTDTGLDDIQFLFSTNIGSKFLPIKDVASGGELSRLTLCAKSLVADAIPLPTLIFDEIDSGISGDVSMRMGLILKELSERHQVISITHTPQIAARADQHYFVYKKVLEHRTVTNVRLLAPDERVRSIAVMLSGNPPSEAALATAHELVAAG